MTSVLFVDNLAFISLWIGLIRRFKHVLEDRLNDPQKFLAEREKYFQRAWSGQPFQNDAWAKQYGDNKTFSVKK